MQAHIEYQNKISDVIESIKQKCPDVRIDKFFDTARLIHYIPCFDGEVRFEVYYTDITPEFNQEVLEGLYLTRADALRAMDKVRPLAKIKYANIKEALTNLHEELDFDIEQNTDADECPQDYISFRLQGFSFMFPYTQRY